MRIKRLRSKIHNVTRRNSTIYATVIDVAPGRATVKIAGTGTKLTMIPVVVDNISIGDNVIVDYSGSVPLVKASV